MTPLIDTCKRSTMWCGFRIKSKVFYKAGQLGNNAGFWNTSYRPEKHCPCHIPYSDITLGALCICSTSRNNAIRAHTVPICRASKQEQFDLRQISISKKSFAARANCLDTTIRLPNSLARAILDLTCSMTHWCVIKFISKTSQFNEKSACLEILRVKKIRNPHVKSRKPFHW